jgi:hypothetical protein
VWARLGLTLGTGQRQLNNFPLLEIGAKPGAITATEPKHIAKRMDRFPLRARFRANAILSTDNVAKANTNTDRTAVVAPGFRLLAPKERLYGYSHDHRRQANRR